MIGWLVLGLLGCGAQEPSDGNAAACEKLCEKVSGCVEKASDTAALPGCDWLENDDVSTCRDRCEQAAQSTLEADCIACLADNLACSGTSSMRPCDADCEPTDLVTGYDYESAASYDYRTYFCE